MTLNVFSWLAWGFGATVVLTVMMAGSQGLRLTRMNIPYLLGSAFTSNRDTAKLVGIGTHLVNGLVFSLLYVSLFHATGLFTWWFGGAMGLMHALFVLAVMMPALPALHPRMASEHQGPTVVRQLEPPGFLARNYGHRTPFSVVVGHVVFGVMLGVFYGPVLPQ